MTPIPCHWCGRSFTPSKTVSGESTERFHGPECGYKSHLARQFEEMNPGLYLAIQEADKRVRAVNRELAREAKLTAEQEVFMEQPRDPSPMPADPAPHGSSHESESDMEEMTLKDVRTKVLHLTIEQMAEKIGTNRSSYWNWETNRRPIPEEFVKRVQILVEERQSNP